MRPLSAEFWHIVVRAHILPYVTFHRDEDDLARLRGIAGNGVLALNVKAITYFTSVYESPVVSFSKFTQHHEQSLQWKRMPFEVPSAKDGEPLDECTMKLEYEKYKRLVAVQDQIRDDNPDLACLKDAVARFTGLRQVTMSSGNTFYEGSVPEKLSPFLSGVQAPTHWPEPEVVRNLEAMLEALACNNHSVESLRAGTLDWSFFDKSSTELARLFRPVLNAVDVELEISMERDHDFNVVRDNSEKCRRLMERGMLRDLLEPMKKLDTLCVMFHGDFNSSRCPVTLKEIVGPGHDWPHLTLLELSKVECDRQALLQVLERHKDTLRLLCLQDIDLGETSWKKLLPNIRNTLDLDNACICGTLTGRSEDAVDSAQLGSWSLSAVGIWDNYMRAPINLYCRHNGKLYPDEVPLTEEVVRKYFEQYVRSYVKKSQAEDREAQRQADADMHRRMQEAGHIPFSDDDSSEIASEDFGLDEDDLDEDVDENDSYEDESEESLDELESSGLPL
ncbi:hypothetical protein diail_12170 [Diaporthe ilicicola]|nr:hypothetical protein diail_12170 [Diaporthe ilicicola]